MPFSQQRTLVPILLLVVDWIGFAVCLTGTIWFTVWWAKLLCGLAAGIMIGRLFIIGHDACHQSYTPNRVLNKYLGRIAMIPSLTPYSLWQVGHNVVHHGYTNLKGVDFVWAPLTLEEYRALSPARRVMERIYRSGWGSGVYYLIEMWWLRMFFPRRQYINARRPEFIRDGIFVIGSIVVWIVLLIGMATWTAQSVWLLLLFGFVIPLVVWNTLIGFVVYVHHTHTDVEWHDNKSEWAAAAPFVSTTVHLTFPWHIGRVFHHIMEHTAHHVDMSIPLYELTDAQRMLETTLPGRITQQRFSWRWYRHTAHRCKLYDFDQSCWTDFTGKRTSPIAPSKKGARPQPAA